MMKKPFKETGFGKFITKPVVKNALGLLPFNVGSTIKDVLEDNDSPAGTITANKTAFNLAKLGVYAVLIYLVLSGKISWDDAEAAKDFVQQ